MNNIKTIVELQNVIHIHYIYNNNESAYDEIEKKELQLKLIEN